MIKSTQLLITFCLIVGLFSSSCNKESEEDENEDEDAISCPDDIYKDKYKNNSNLPDNTIQYWGKQHSLSNVDFAYTQHGDYSILFKNSEIELEILFRPPTVKNCSHILQTESTLPYSSKLGSGYSTRIGFVLWDKKNYWSATSCQTSDSEKYLGYAKLTANESTFNLSFDSLLVHSTMYGDKPYQPVSLNLTLNYDCSVVCPK